MGVSLNANIRDRPEGRDNYTIANARKPPTAEIHMRRPFLSTTSVMRGMLGDRLRLIGRREWENLQICPTRSAS